MTPQELRRFLRDQKLKPAHIEADTDISVSTVYRFLRGEPLNDSTLRALTDWVSKVTESNRKVAAG